MKKIFISITLIVFVMMLQYAECSDIQWTTRKISSFSFAIPSNWSEQKLIFKENEYRFWNEDRLVLLRIYVLDNSENMKAILDRTEKQIEKSTSKFRKVEQGLLNIQNGNAFYIDHTNNEQVMRTCVTRSGAHNVLMQFICAAPSFIRNKKKIDKICTSISVSDPIEPTKDIVAEKKETGEMPKETVSQKAVAVAKPEKKSPLKPKKIVNKVSKDTQAKPSSKTLKPVPPKKVTAVKPKPKTDLKLVTVKPTQKKPIQEVTPNVQNKEKNEPYRPKYLRNPFNAPSRKKVIFEESSEKPKVQDKENDSRVNYMYITDDMKKRAADQRSNGFVNPKVLYLMFSVKGLPKAEKLYSIWQRKDGMKKILTYTIKNAVVENGYFYMAEDNFLKPSEYNVTVKYRGAVLGTYEYMISKDGANVKKIEQRAEKTSETIKKDNTPAPVKVIDACFCKKIINLKAQGISKQFDPDVGSVYAWYKLDVEQADTQVMLKWYLGDTYILETPLQIDSGERVVSFSLEMTEGKQFPVGLYYARLYFKDQLVSVMSFSVK